MSDIDRDLRQLFQRRADDVPPHREVPRSLVTRARRRMARNALGAGLVVVALAAGAFTGVRALGGLPAPHRPIGQPSSTPTTPITSPTPSPSGIQGCGSADLRAVGSLEGAAGSRGGAITVTNLSAEACTLEGSPTITLLDQNLEPITAGITFDATQPAWAVDGSPQPPGWPVVTLQPGDSGSVRVRWSNWCADGGAAPLWRIEIPGGGTVDVDGMDAVSPPPCNGPGQPSTIEVGPFEPGPQP